MSQKSADISADVGERTRALLVGCGDISRTWLRAVRDIPELEIVGLVDIRPQAAKQLAVEFELEQNVAIAEELGSALDHTGAEVVFNCTVPEAHLAVTLDALERGCHVLTEKPLADSMVHARQLVDAAQTAGRLLAVVQNRRYDARIRQLRHFLRSGALGSITTVHSDFFMGAHTNSFRDRIEHPLLLDMAIHTFDAARLITGADPVSVYCHEWNPAGSWYDGDASLVAIFEMSAGIVYTYRGSWCAEGLNTTWESDWRIMGERGAVTWDGADDFRVEVVDKTGSFYSEMKQVKIPSYNAGDKTGGHGGVIREFIRCVRLGGTPETVGTDNIRSLAMVFAAIQSTGLHRAVAVDLSAH